MSAVVPDVDLSLVMLHLRQLLIAFVFALPIAINREHQAEAAGMRTFPLVAIACCAFMLVGMDVYDGSDAEARVMYGIITGMGFVGGGSIVKKSGQADGTATAAALWLTGAIGISVAYHRYEIALVLSICGYLIFQFSRYLKPRLQNRE